jgi:hypothetical protein
MAKIIDVVRLVDEIDHALKAVHEGRPETVALTEEAQQMLREVAALLEQISGPQAHKTQPQKRAG